MTPDRRRRAPDRARTDDEPVAIGDALTSLRADWGLPDPSVFDVLVARWDELVGAGIAAHAQPRSLRNDVLTIEVDAAPWATELRYLETELRARVEQLLGRPGFAEVRVVVAR
jgi:predicted nucleic acid-binding Zn ribbon protein